MAGEFANKGFNYQKKITVYYILDALFKKELASCKIELEIEIDKRFEKASKEEPEPHIIQSDFRIIANTNALENYFEVKDQEKFYSEAKIRSIVKRFFKLFLEYKQIKQLCQFNLIHSTQKKEYLDKLYIDSPKKVDQLARLYKKWCKMLNVPVSEAEIFEFLPLFTTRQILDDIDPHLKKSSLDLINILLIRKIMKEFCPIISFEDCEGIYSIIIGHYDNFVREAVTMLKNSHYQKVPSKIKALEIDIKAILDLDNSVFDILAQKLTPKPKEEIRTSFLTYYKIPFKNDLEVITH